MHYLTLVLHSPSEDIDGIMERFGPCDGQQSQYAEFEDRTIELKSEWEENRVITDDKEMSGKTLKQYYKSFRRFCTEYFGCVRHNGRYGHWENPNQIWDWYVVGGRVKDTLIIKNHNQTKMSDRMRLFNIKLSGDIEGLIKEYGRTTCQLGVIDWQAMNLMAQRSEPMSMIQKGKKWIPYYFVYPGTRPCDGYEFIEVEQGIDFYDKYLKHQDANMQLTVVDCQN